MRGREFLQHNRTHILQLAEKRGAGNVRVFGSIVHGNETENSDIDILVIMKPGRSLLDLVGLNLDLTDLLQRDVDVVDEESLSPYIRDRILAEATPI